MGAAQKHRAPLSMLPCDELYLPEDHYVELAELDEKLKTNGFAFHMSESTVEDEEGDEFTVLIATVIHLPSIRLSKEHLSVFDARAKSAAWELFGNQGEFLCETRSEEPELHYLRRVIRSA